MGLRGITQEFYESLVNAFRALPGDQRGGLRQAALAADCDERTAKKAWETGFSRGWQGARRPIREIIQEEQELARARLAEQQDEAQRKALEAEALARLETKQKAAREATESRTQEGQMVRLLRGNTLAVLGNIMRLNQTLQKAGAALQATVDAWVQPDPVTGKVKPLLPGEVRILRELVSTTTTSLSQAASAASQALEAERLLLGEPGKLIGVQVQVENLTWSQAQQKLTLANRALARMASRGAVIDASLSPDAKPLTADPPADPTPLALAPFTQDPHAATFLSTLGTMSPEPSIVPNPPLGSPQQTASLTSVRVRGVG